jgi:glutathione synthase/RimK-type ligase-like ATP-grasp enzyme
VLKPRFGSWGREVFLCRDRDELSRTVATLSEREWFRSHGALAQEVLPLLGYDLRIVVAAGRVVGAARRDAAPGEWRTNVALGGMRSFVIPPAAAVELALTAAAAAGADLIGVDLMPTTDDSWSVLELNGAVDFNHQYVRQGDVYANVVGALLEAAASRQAA